MVLIPKSKLKPPAGLVVGVMVGVGVGVSEDIGVSVGVGVGVGVIDSVVPLLMKTVPVFVAQVIFWSTVEPVPPAEIKIEFNSVVSVATLAVQPLGPPI